MVNMAFATINVINPSVSVSNPRFTVSARKPEHEAQAMFTEEVINYLWRINKYHSQFRLCVNDWLLFGHGWMKVGYKFVTEPKVKSGEPGSDDVGDEGVEDREEKEGNVESEINVLDDRPFAERISPDDMFVDADGKTMDDIAWIAQRIRRPVNDVRVDQRYEPKARKEAQPTTSQPLRQHVVHLRSLRQPVAHRGERQGFVDVIEFYDIRRKTYCVFADGSNEGFLIKPKKMPYAFGHPFLMLRNYEVPDEFYPMGELQEIEQLQLELNETRTQMLNHRKRFARKYLYMEDALDDVGIVALESDEDNTMVPVNAGQDINRVIIPLPSVGTPPEFYNQSQMIEDDMDKVSGVSDYMRGNSPDIRRTATEAAMIQDAQNSRGQDKMSRIENFLGQLGGRLIQLLQQYMTGEQVVRVVGPSAMPIWITYDKDYIEGEFDLEVEAGSTQPQNETFKRQSAMQLVDAMAPFAGAGVINVAELAKYVLQMGFGIKDPDAFISSEMAPPQPGAAAGEPEGPPELPPGQPPPPGVPPPGGAAPPPQAAGPVEAPPPAGAPSGMAPGPPGAMPPGMAGPPPGMPPGGLPPGAPPPGAATRGRASARDVGPARTAAPAAPAGQGPDAAGAAGPDAARTTPPIHPAAARPVRPDVPSTAGRAATADVTGGQPHCLVDEQPAGLISRGTSRCPRRRGSPHAVGKANQRQPPSRATSTRPSTQTTTSASKSTAKRCRYRYQKRWVGTPAPLTTHARPRRWPNGNDKSSSA